MSLRRKGFAVVAPPVIGLCLATAAFFVAARQNTLNRRAVERGEEVTAQLRLVLGLAIDAESGARGFVLTGEERFLEPFVAARTALPAALQKLDSLFGETGQSQTVAALRPLIERRLQISSEMGRQSAAVASLPAGVAELLDQGRSVTDAIRRHVSDMEAVERAASARARASAERAENLGRAALFAGLLLGLIGGLGGAVLFTQGVARRVIGLLRSADDLAHGKPVVATPGGSDEVGQLGLALSQASDLLRQRERALEDARHFLARLLDSAPTVVLRVQLPNLDCVYVSPNATRVLGLPPVAEPDFLRKRLHPDFVTTIKAAARRMTADGESVRLEALFVAGGDVHRWVSLVMLPEFDESADVRTALVYLNDDDERYRAQAELKEREATLQAVLDASPDVITITAADGTITLANPAVESVLGWPTKNLLERSHADFVHPDDAVRMRAAFEALLEGTESHSVVAYRAKHVDGRLVTLESHASALRDNTGQPVAVVAVTRDISERVRIEEIQREARETAERANRSKSEFISRMSHELRTPLNAVIGFAQLLELDDLTAEQRESVNYILKGGRHLLDLIDEILDIARIEAGRLKLSAEPVSVSEALADVVEMVGSMAARADVEILEWSVTPDLHVLADRQRLVQILLNLLSNAVKYNRPQGTVQITCQRADAGRIQVDVIDTGFGIRNEDLPLLFSPFERLGAEQTAIEGTGIGLALSRQLAEAMGGCLEVSSLVGRGSTFSLVLPEAEGQVERYERLNGDAVRSVIPSRGGTVLHIEDNLSNLKLVERILARHASMRVVATMQGRLGIQLAREHRPRVVLLDLHLPDIGGDEVLRQLRDDPATSNIPVVIVSADATRGEIQRLLAAGAAGYVTKPIDVRELLRVLDDVLTDEPDA
ncbi:MAG: ATP-binding protein [Actinomycetota bacterium]